jgi:hypothetical protein
MTSRLRPTAGNPNAMARIGKYGHRDFGDGIVEWDGLLLDVGGHQLAVPLRFDQDRAAARSGLDDGSDKGDRDPAAER